MKGDFTIFGFTPNPGSLLDRALPQRLGITPRRLEFGDAGALFFHTTYGEIAETEDVVGIKLGWMRAPDQAPLSTEALLRRGIVSPQNADPARMRGNALVVCLSKQAPSLMAYKTLLATPQLYYTTLEGHLICTDRLACLVRLLDRVELDEAVLPMHFLFRSTPGELTYYRNVRRMAPGAALLWNDNRLSLTQRADLSFNGANGSIKDCGPGPQDRLYAVLECVLSDSVSQAEAHGQQVGMLLSGGVDSSLLQLILSQASPGREPRSYSYAVQASSFAREIDYARLASDYFQTRHTFVEFGGEEFAGLLTRTVEHLAQPPVLETEPSILAIAERAQLAEFQDRYFVSGQGADALFGLDISRKLKGLHQVSRVPGAPQLLRGMSLLAKPFPRTSHMLHKGAEIIDGAGDAGLFSSPTNTVGVYWDIDQVCRCFGVRAVQDALAYRREWAARFLRTDHYLESVHLIDLVTDAYEVDVQRRQLFLAHHREQIHPFFDDDVLQAGFAFHPDVRYIRGWRPKHLLRSLLERKTGAPAARKPKGFSIFETELMQWISAGGPLRPMVEAIDRPGFLSQADFERLLQTPNYFLWSLLAYDIFQKRVRAIGTSIDRVKIV